MKRKTKFDLYVEQLLLEMPQMIHGDLGFVRNEKQNDVHLQYIKTYWTFIEKATINGIPLNIWGNNPLENNMELTFVDDHDQILARCEYVLNSDNSITMEYIWQLRHAKELMSAIFLEYLLPQHTAIISDNMQTMLGFRFYQKMFFYTRHDNLQFSVINRETDEEIQITDAKQLDDYFGDNEDFAKYRFKISK